MIVISFLLVVIAAVTLLVGLFQDTLTWIWASIGACVLAMIFLGIGVLQRRSSRHEPDEADESAYGPGAISSLMSGGDEEDEEAAAAGAREEVSVVPKRSLSDARGEISRAEVEEAADAAVADAAGESETEEAPAAPAKSTKKAAKKKTAKKAAKKTAKKTTGKAARERLDEIKGLGPAKQKALLSEFGSLEAIRDADVEALQQVKGIGEATAKEIQKQLS